MGYPMANINPREGTESSATVVQYARGAKLKKATQSKYDITLSLLND